MTIIAGLLIAALIIQQILHNRRMDCQIRAWRVTATEIADSVAYYIPDLRTGCWEWQRGKTRGYGTVGRKRGRTGLAHRLYYEGRYGPVPKGLVLDHVCCSKGCVNPDHLEPVTQAENTGRWREGNPEQHAASLVAAQERRHP